MILTVFANRREAECAGFRGRHHRANEHVQAWWPQLGEVALVRLPIEAVFVTRRASESLTTEHAQLLRKRQATFGERAVWIEL